MIYKDFFEHLVNNDKDSFDYLLDWLSFSITGRNQTMLVAVGEQGIGKGILGEIMRELHGHENYAFTSDRSLSGNFNSTPRELIKSFD